MFDGGAASPSDQFHQFISSPISFPPPNTVLPFIDPNTYNNNNHQLQLPLLQPNNNNNLFHSLLMHHKHNKEPIPLSSNINYIDSDSSPSSSWTNEEVVALLRIRSTMDITTTWDHVSRKLEELGFNKSAEKCKEKFEDETKYFNNFKNYRFLSHQLEQDHHHLYQSDPTNHHHLVTLNPIIMEASGDTITVTMDRNADESPTKQNNCDERTARKRKRRGRRFEMLKGMCERMVNKMMAQQEEIHNKLLDEMTKREQEKLAREEAWKKQEMDKLNKELHLMAQEQAIAGHRQASILHFLNKFAAAANNNNTNSPATTSHYHDHDRFEGEEDPNPNGGTSSRRSDSLTNILNNLKTAVLPKENPSSSDTTKLQAHNSSSPSNSSPDPENTRDHDHQSNSASNYKPNSSKTGEKSDNVGRRWPRDEVLALINLRCTSLMKKNNNNDVEEKVATPLWERISKGMAEMGYDRSAKRCKEKWENINKYFRKTKDNVNKKRSLDSRTCPYFHQLTTLYSTQSSANPATVQAQPETSQVGSGVVHCGGSGGDGGENNNFDTIVPPLNFD